MHNLHIYIIIIIIHDLANLRVQSVSSDHREVKLKLSNMKIER